MSFHPVAIVVGRVDFSPGPAGDVPLSDLIYVHFIPHPLAPRHVP
jgi:hypothetical protein